ncbi:MAG: 2,3-bisphosphoglycerate-dependent phosphoglycerate mutase [Gammaproteobacteria bacterium]
MSYLVLVRHGQSEWNAKNLFTGWKDPDLTELGIEEANKAGSYLKELNIKFDVMFTSNLIRAQKTGDIILKAINQTPQIIKNLALNERNYGDLSGLNKDDARKRWGEEQVHIWRRSFDVPPPGGESLKNTAERVLPYFDEVIMPEVLKVKNILVAAHGNSLRSLVMKLDGLSAEEVVALEIPTGAPIVYELSNTGAIISKQSSF